MKDSNPDGIDTEIAFDSRPGGRPTEAPAAGAPCGGVAWPTGRQNNGQVVAVPHWKTVWKKLGVTFKIRYSVPEL